MDCRYVKIILNEDFLSSEHIHCPKIMEKIKKGVVWAVERVDILPCGTRMLFLVDEDFKEVGIIPEGLTEDIIF